MRVLFLHRRPWPQGNFSIEYLFKQIRGSLPADVQWEVKELKYHSKGFFKRIYIACEAAFSQIGINHITGDITFVAILLRKSRTVLTMLDLGFMNHPNPAARFLLKWFWIRLPVRRSAVVTTISLSTKRDILSRALNLPSA